MLTYKELKMKTEYRVCACTEYPDTNPRREWIFQKEFNVLSRAKQLAIKLSSKDNWAEVEIQGVDIDGELVHHSYWQDGKLEIDMSV